MELHKKKFLEGHQRRLNLKFNVFFCGEKCAIEADPKNPNRFKKNPGKLFVGKLARPFRPAILSKTLH